MLCRRPLVPLAVVLLWLSSAAAAQTPLTLRDALSRAEALAPELAAADARVEAASAGLDYAGALPNPSLELRSENWAAGADRSDVTPDTFVVASQVIELGGKRRARREVAAADLNGTRTARESAARTLQHDVVALYLEALRADAQHRVLAMQADDLAELVRIVERRVAVGTTAEADLLKLRSDLARVRIDLVRAAAAADQARMRLGARLDLDVAAGSLQLPSMPPLPDADLAASIERRPDVQAATRSVEAARARLRMAGAAAVPDAMVEGGVKRTAGVNTGVLAVGISLPVFARNRQARALAAGELAAAERQLDATRRRAHGEITAAHAAAQRYAREVRQIRTALVEPASEARTAIRAAFGSGTADILSLLDAERVAADAERMALDLEVDAIRAAIEARLAAGEDPLP